MQPAIVLATESHPAIDDLPLPRRAKLDRHLRADRAAIAARADKLQLEPVARGALVLIDQRTSLLVRDHHVERTSIEQIRHGNRTAIQAIGDTGRLRDILKATAPAIEQHARALVPRKARAADRRPILRVLENVTLRTRD